MVDKPTSAAPDKRMCQPCRRVRREAAEAAALVRTCLGCGEHFTRWQNYKHPGSAATRCQLCYNDYVRLKRNPDGKRRPKPTTHGKKPSGPRWRALQEQVWATETHCGFCGEHVDQSLHHNDRMARSLDHIVPISQGGPMYERSNVRLAHRSCNAKAGNALTGARTERETILLLRASLWINDRLAS